MKRTLSFLLSLIIVIGIITSVPVTVSAASESDLTFELNEDGMSYSVIACDESAEGEIVIPATYNDLPVNYIGNSSFRYCKKITGITVYAKITQIDAAAFIGCENLSIFNFPDSLKRIFTLTESEKPFESTAFYKDDNNWDNGALYINNILVRLKENYVADEYVIRSDTVSIAEYAFYNCESIKSAVLPEKLESIGERAFYGCANLIRINIPKQITNIGNYTFSRCQSLQSIALPDGLTFIGQAAFSYCKALKEIVIPENVGAICDYAFLGCDNLIDITILGDSSIMNWYYPFGYTWNSGTCEYEKLDSVVIRGLSGGEAETYAKQNGFTFISIENPVPPTTPKLKSVSNAIDGVKVVWNAVDGADEYIVYRKTAKSGWAKLGTTAETTFTDKTAKSGTTYYYTVKAQNGAGASGYNKTGLAIKYLAAPKLSKVYNNGKGNVLSWGKVTGASGYYVYRKTPSSGWSKVATIKKGTTASYTDKKVTYGKTYIYTVKAYSGKTTSSFNTNGVTILKKIPNVTITTKNVNGGKKVTLSSSISGATIYYKTSKDGKYKKYTGEFGLTSTKTIYAYAVRSGYYKSSTASKKITVTKVKTPSVVVKNCVGGKKISFTSGTAGATFYYKTSKNGSYVKYTEPFTLASTKTIYVKAYKPGYATSSTASKKVSVSKIGTPTGLVVKSYASTSTKISWKKVTGAQGYFIYRATEKDGPYTLVHTIKSGTTVSKTDTGLEPTTTYYYKVRAYCSGKASSSYTAVAGATTKATPTTTDAKKFFNGLNGIWGGAYLKLFAKPGDKDFKYDTIFCMKYHTYDFYSNQTSYKSYLTLSSTGKKSTVKISSIMSEAEYKKYINKKNYDHWRVYKVSDLQAILDKTWAPGTFKVKDWADGKDHIVTSKGYFLMNMPDRGLDAANVVTEIKNCEKVDGKFYLEVYMLNYDFWGEKIYDVSTGSYATVNGYGYELTSVEQFCADAGITKDQLGTVTVVIKETSSGLRLESMS